MRIDGPTAYTHGMNVGTKLSAGSASEWRAWLEQNGDSARDIWLVLYKKSSGKGGLAFMEALEEALCFGWIDSQMKGLDAESYALRFTPRRARARWSAGNLDLARRLVREGRMTQRGLVALPPDWSFEAQPAEERS